MKKQGKQIRQVRKHWGLTQQQLADHAGISRSLLDMAETGKRRLKKHVMEHLLSYKPVLWHCEPVDQWLDEQKRYIANKKAVLAYEVKKVVRRKQSRLTQVKRKYEVLLAEWSAAVYQTNFFRDQNPGPSVRDKENKLGELQALLMQCDLIVQYQLEHEIQRLKRSTKSLL